MEMIFLKNLDNSNMEDARERGFVIILMNRDSFSDYSLYRNLQSEHLFTITAKNNTTEIPKEHQNNGFDLKSIPSMDNSSLLLKQIKIEDEFFMVRKKEKCWSKDQIPLHVKPSSFFKQKKRILRKR